MNFITSKEQKSILSKYKDHLKLGFEVEGLHINSCLEKRFNNRKEQIEHWDKTVSVIINQIDSYFYKMEFPEQIEKILILHAISIIRSIIESHILNNIKSEQEKFYKIYKLQEQDKDPFFSLVKLLHGLEFSGDVPITSFIINKEQSIIMHFNITLDTNLTYGENNIEYISLDQLYPNLEYVLDRQDTHRIIKRQEQFEIYKRIVSDLNEVTKLQDIQDIRDAEIYQKYLSDFLQDIYVNYNESRFEGITPYDANLTSISYNITKFISENKQLFQDMIYTKDINSRSDIRYLISYLPPKIQKTITGTYNVYKELQMKFKNEYGYKTLYSKTYNGTEHGINWQNKFRFEPDFSIEGKGTPIEIITPPLTYNKQMECLSNVFDFMKNNDIIVNDTCGFHVNISVDGFKQTNVDYNILFYLYKDENFRLKFRGNPNEIGYKNSIFNQMPLYVKETIKDTWNRSRKIPKNNKQLMQKINKFYDELSSKLYDKSLYTKYNCVHNHKEYLEFRTIGNKYMDLKILKKYIDIIAISYLFSLLKPNTLVQKQKQKSFKIAISD